MGRGGFRPGAGRPKGTTGIPKTANSKTPKSKLKKSKPRKSNAPDEVPADIAAAAKAEEMSPLDYMLKVMRNPEADQTRRDRMAIAAAPFVHGRGTEQPGKKQQTAEKAKAAAAGRFAAPSAPRLFVDNTKT